MMVGGWRTTENRPPILLFSFPSSICPWAGVQTGSLTTCPLHRGMHPAKYNVLVGGEPVIVGIGAAFQAGYGIRTPWSQEPSVH